MGANPSWDRGSSSRRVAQCCGPLRFDITIAPLDCQRTFYILLARFVEVWFVFCMAENRIFNLPSSAKCPRCNQPLNVAMGVTHNSTAELKKGKIILCGQCAYINVVGDSGLRPMTKEEFDKQPDATKAALKIAINRINQIQAGRQ